VPIYDTDVCFAETRNSKKQPKLVICTCTAHGELRLYDPVSNVRPVSRMDINKSKVLHKVAPWTQDSVVAVNQEGELLVCSLKSQFKLLHKLMGSQTGSQNGLLQFRQPEFGAYMLSVGLDRYLRVFSEQTRREVGRLYLGNKLV